MDLRKLKTLIDLVAESGIAELEITEGDDKVRIVKSGSAPQTSHVSHVYAAPTTSPMAAATPIAGRARRGTIWTPPFRVVSGLSR